MHPKKLEPLLISATVKTSNFKFGIQHGFGTILPKKTTFRTKVGGGAGSAEHPKKIWDPLFISVTIEASD